MVCLFCFRESRDGIPISVESAREIICKYFWFDINEIISTPQYSCSDCWTRIESFHKFYLMVESVHQSNFHVNDDKSIPTIVYESDPQGDAECGIKLENDTTEPYFVEPHTVFIQSPSSSDREFDAEPIDQEPNEWPEIEEKKEESSTAKLSTRKRTKANIKAKSVSNKSNSSKPRKIQQSIQTAREFRCYMCDKMFTRFRNIRNHFHVHDPPESRTLECDLCGKRYSNVRVLRQHMENHMAREKNAKRSKNVREKKIRLKKPKKVHICEVCGKEFSAPSPLAQHSLTHVDRELTQVQCELCGKWIKNRNVLRSHMYIHNQTPKKCPYCDKIKQTGRALQAHITRSHSAPTHPCTFCEKSFTRPEALREHIATHTGEHLYTCLYCPKTFKSNSNKYMHMRKNHLEQWNIDRAKRINSL